MGMYIQKSVTELLADGAVEQVHPHYEKYLVVRFDPDPPNTYMVTAFVYSRKEFWRFFNNPLPTSKRWFVYPNVVKLVRPDTIRLHELDVAGPDTFEEIDRREEMAALMKDEERRRSEGF